jgi:hypothetical protein
MGISGHAMPKETDPSRRRFAIAVVDGSSPQDHDLPISSMGFGSHVEANRAAACWTCTRPDVVPREVRRPC